MLPIDQLGDVEARRLDGLLFDLDDTFLDRGRLTEQAYASLFRLRESALALFVVTGRPSSWGTLLARQWPIDAALTENGSIAVMARDGAAEQIDLEMSEGRATRAEQLMRIVGELRAKFPDFEPSEDVTGRISDYTFDVGERRHVRRARVSEAAAFARELGARTLASTVHLHITLDGLDKASGMIRLLHRLRGVDPTLGRYRYAFIGDSENDESCFAAFHTTIAVRNLSGRPSVMPRFCTSSDRSAGFVEAAEVLVRRRAS